MPEGLERWKQHKKKKEVAPAKKFVEAENWKNSF